jgi:predicted phosphodiesterase
MAQAGREGVLMQSSFGFSNHVGSHLVVVLPDLHIPFQDKKALECALRAVQYLKPHKVVILGDWLDCEAFSAHGKKNMVELRAHRYIADEVDPCREILKELEGWSKEIVYIEGNHEHRVERFAVNWGGILGPELYKLISPRALLGEGRKSGWSWVPYGTILPHHSITPNLWAVHGWSHAKHSASKHLEKAGSVSVVHGHTHRTQLFAKRDVVSGRVLKAWSPGCLSGLQPIYMHQNPTEWVHGFSLVYVGSDPEDWTDYTVTIQNGRCILPDGKEIIA